PSALRRGSYFSHLHVDQNEAAALHAAGVSVALASHGPTYQQRALSENGRVRCDVRLSCPRLGSSSVRRPIFSGGTTLPPNAERLAPGRGIRRNRFSGAEFGLVFS